MPKKIANKDARQYVQRLEEFDGSNMYARKYVTEHPDLEAPETKEHYVVYSYGEHFPMFIHVAGQWFRNKDRYDMGGSFSRTTPKQMGQCHPHADTFPLSTQWMKVLAKQGYTALTKMRVIDGVTWI